MCQNIITPYEFLSRIEFHWQVFLKKSLIWVNMFDKENDVNKIISVLFSESCLIHL